jgi:hypothetical protein
MVIGKSIAVCTTVAHRQSKMYLSALDGLFEDRVEVFSQVQPWVRYNAVNSSAQEEGSIGRRPPLEVALQRLRKSLDRLGQRAAVNIMI